MNPCNGEESRKLSPPTDLESMIRFTCKRPDVRYSISFSPITNLNILGSAANASLVSCFWVDRLVSTVSFLRLWADDILVAIGRVLLSRSKRHVLTHTSSNSEFL